MPNTTIHPAGSNRPDNSLDVNQTIDNARFNRFHWRVLLLCALIIIFDGYDLVIYGVVLPVLMKEWHLTPLQAGSLGTEARLSRLCAWVLQADRLGLNYGLRLPGLEIKPGSGEAHKRQCLEALALC